MTIILTSASSTAHFCSGINTKYDQEAPALISACFTYLHHSSSLGGLKKNIIYKDGLSPFSGLQREYDPLGAIVFKFLCISSA